MPSGYVSILKIETLWKMLNCDGDLLFSETKAEWDYSTLVVSLYKRSVSKGNRRYYNISNGRELKNSKLAFVIEDPVQVGYNCAKNVRKFTVNLMRIEFYRSLMILEFGDGDFHRLCARSARL